MSLGGLEASAMARHGEDSGNTSSHGHSRLTRADGTAASGIASLSAIEETMNASGLHTLSQSYAEGTDLRRRLQEVVDGDLAQERRRQVEDLATKAVSLEFDRERARDELQFAEQQYRRHVQDAQAQLAQVRNEHSRMECELENLRQQLRKSKSSSSGEWKLEEDEAIDRATSLQDEVQRLNEMRTSTEQKIQAMQTEVQQMREKLEGVHATRMRAVEDSSMSVQTAHTLRESLDMAKQQLAQSEQVRARLRDRYLNAGQRFEQVLGSSEKDKQDVLVDLQHEMTLNWNRCEKYRQRLDEVEKELNAAQASSASQKEVLGCKDAEVARLQEALESERELQRQREAQHFESQQRQLQDQNSELQSLSEMISLSAHQKLLDDQASNYRDKMKELEQRLKQEAQTSPTKVSPRHPQSNADYHGRQARAHRQESLPPRYANASASPLHDEGFRQDSLDNGFNRLRARASKLEVETKQVKQSHQRIELAAAKADEQRQALSVSLAEAHSHLSRLHRIVEDERWAGQELHLEAAEAKAEADAAAAELVSRTANFRATRSESVESDRLSISVREQNRKISSLEEGLEGLRRDCHGRELEASVLRGEHQTLAAVLASAEKHTSELQANHAQDITRYNRHCETSGRIQQLLKRHIKESRAEVHQLRTDLQWELRQLQDRCQDQVRQCLRSLQVQSFNSGFEDTAHNQAVEDARRRKEDLEQQLAKAHDQETAHQQRLEELLSEEMQQKAAQAQAEAGIQAHRCGMERILQKVGSVVALTGSSFSLPQFGSGNVGGPEVAMPELLVQLRTTFDASLLGLRKSVEHAEHKDFEARLAAEERRDESLSEHKRAEASSAVRDLERRRDSAALDMNQHRTKEEDDLRDHAACLLKLDAETREKEAELRTAQQVAQDAASKAASVEINLTPSAQSISSWRSEAAAPLRRDLSGLLGELEQLQVQYTQGWDERETDWATRCARIEDSHREKGVHAEMRLQQEASALRIQLEEHAQVAREENLAAEQRVADLREKLRANLSEASSAADACRVLQSECNIAEEDGRHVQSMLDQAEAHHVEVEQAGRRDRERSEQLELQARRQRERELGELKRAEVAEAARMRSFLQHTLSTISAAATLDESPIRSRVHSGVSGETGGDSMSVRE